MILRNYGGAFDQFININENFIAKKLNRSKSEVIKTLIQLEKDNILKYQRSTADMEIKFLVPRDKQFVMGKISQNLKRKNKMKIQKAKSIIEYIENNEICRNIQLLHYFGEKKLTNCGTCDVCLTKNKSGLKIDYESISIAINKLIKTDKPISFDELVNLLDFDKESIIKTLQLMIEKNLIGLTLQNKIFKLNGI